MYLRMHVRTYEECLCMGTPISFGMRRFCVMNIFSNLIGRNKEESYSQD